MDTATELPLALARALPLLATPPAEPDATDGYLDLLGEEAAAESPGLIQSLWASGPGAAAYDLIQSQSRKVLSAWQLPVDWLAPPPDGVVLDIGSGPGNVTAQLARRMGPDGLALGVDVSVPMLQRAVRAAAGPNVGFLRADARALPFRDDTAHALVNVAALQLIPEPALVLGEFVRVLRPGGRLAIMVPTVAGGLMHRLIGLLPGSGGAHFFGEEEIADALEGYGLEKVRSKQAGPVQWVRGRKPE